LIGWSCVYGHHVGAAGPCSASIIRYFALLATCASLNAAAATPSRLTAEHLPRIPLAIYYSFDTAPPAAALIWEMQSELGRILEPAGLGAIWRPINAPRDAREDFPEIVVFRFQGTCAFDTAPGSNGGPDQGGLPLAETELSDGHVLPFGKVNCDIVRHLIAPAKSQAAAQKNAALGRALARVVAHEIYHMLTASTTHASQGIARPAHSRADLTASSFRFAATETNWLRSWVEKQVQVAAALPSEESPTAALSSSALSSSPESVESDSASLAGR
jgi:hypothetical protein